MSDSRMSQRYSWKSCDGSPLAHLVRHLHCTGSSSIHNFLRFLGLPHRLRQDDTHAGYFLPKDTIVLANIWYVLNNNVGNDSTGAGRCFGIPVVIHVQTSSILSDSSRERASSRKPILGRWCSALEDGTSYIPHDRILCSVFVLRNRAACAQVSENYREEHCPNHKSIIGSHLAELTLFLILSMSLASFEITKPIVNGKVVEPSMVYTSGTIRCAHVNRIGVLISTRSQATLSAFSVQSSCVPPRSRLCCPRNENHSSPLALEFPLYGKEGNACISPDSGGVVISV